MFYIIKTFKTEGFMEISTQIKPVLRFKFKSSKKKLLQDKFNFINRFTICIISLDWHTK